MVENYDNTKNNFSDLKQPAMHISHEESGNKGIFFIKESDNVIAEMTYYLPGDSTVIIDHTWVDDALRGKKVGNDLIEKAVEFARARKYTIIPQCSFAKTVFGRDKAKYKDILQAG